MKTDEQEQQVFPSALQEKGFNLKLSGNEVDYTNALLLPIRIMLCSKLHCQKVFRFFSYTPPPLPEGGTLCRIATEILTVEGLGLRGLGFGCTLAQPPAHFGCVAPVISAARRGTDTQTHQMRHFGKLGPCAHRFHAPRTHCEDRVGPTERVYRVVLHNSIPAQIRALILYYYGYKE